jgi:6-pyruvoyl-tetrahydropterin synthase
VFSKKASNQLPLYYTHNYKIQLKNANSLNNIEYSPLYYYLVVKLEEVKRYITENLDKRFINTSQALFISLILFIKKKDNSLWFCINYRKLNNLTYKNQYLLSLINKTLARITKAKIFIKLDIQQAFHYICISPESKELITF